MTLWVRQSLITQTATAPPPPPPPTPPTTHHPPPATRHPPPATRHHHPPPPPTSTSTSSSSSSTSSTTTTTTNGGGGCITQVEQFLITLPNGRNITVRLRYFSLDFLSIARMFPVTCKKGERKKHKKGQSYHTITSAIHACTLYRLTHRRHLHPGDYLIHTIRLEWRHVALQNWLCVCVWLVCTCAYSCASSRAYSCVCRHVEIEACVNCSSAVATCLHILDACFEPLVLIDRNDLSVRVRSHSSMPQPTLKVNVNDAKLTMPTVQLKVFKTAMNCNDSSTEITARKQRIKSSKALASTSAFNNNDKKRILVLSMQLLHKAKVAS